MRRCGNSVTDVDVSSVCRRVQIDCGEMSLSAGSLRRHHRCSHRSEEGRVIWVPIQEVKVKIKAQCMSSSKIQLGGPFMYKPIKSH